MKQKHFYSHLIETTNITLELGEMNLSREERVHLLALIDANIHSAVVNTVLSDLSEEDKRGFLSNLTINDHDKTWKHLRERSKDIDKKIIDAVEGVKKELLNDIKRARAKKKI